MRMNGTGRMDEMRRDSTSAMRIVLLAIVFCTTVQSGADEEDEWAFACSPDEIEDRDRGWTVELAFPWKSLKWLALADDRALPPNDGDVWRIDFSRFNQYRAAPAVDAGGWAWSTHRVWDSHVPECFPYIAFSSATLDTR